MTTTPSDDPQVPSTGATPPPPPPASSGYDAPVPPPAPGGYPAAGQVPPAQGYGGAPGGYAGGPAPAYQAGPAQPLSDSDQRMWATLGHIGGVIFSFVAPLIVWLVHKDRGQFVEEQSKEALNFQIMIAIGYVICSILTVVVIGAFLLPIVWLISLIFGILAAVATNKGEAYRYPFSLRLIK